MVRFGKKAALLAMAGVLTAASVTGCSGAIDAEATVVTVGKEKVPLDVYKRQRVSRSLRDTAYKAIYAKEGYIKRHMKEPTVQEIAEEIGIAKEEIVYALDAIQMPMSLHEPVYSDGQDALFVMDQVSDKKNKEENWIEELSLEAAMERLNERERYIITPVSYTHLDVYKRQQFGQL